MSSPQVLRAGQRVVAAPQERKEPAHRGVDPHELVAVVAPPARRLRFAGESQRGAESLGEVVDDRVVESPHRAEPPPLVGNADTAQLLGGERGEVPAGVDDQEPFAGEGVSVGQRHPVDAGDSEAPASDRAKAGTRERGHDAYYRLGGAGA
jgi:hypothetical protein